jgi:hypothetical protein
MLLINAAWTVLSDPAERARYDRARQPRVVPKPTGNGTSNSTPNGRTRVDGWVGGTSPGASASGASTRSAANAGSRYNATKGRRSNPRTRTLTMVFEAAELYFFHGRAAEAIAMCNQVLQLDPRNAEAAALLGDIFAEQGRREGAIAMYERAVRSQPDNALYRQKWEALRSGAPGSPAYAPYGAASAHRGANGATSGTSGNGARGTPAQSGAGVRVGTGRSGAVGAHGTNGVTGASTSSASAATRHVGGAPPNGSAAARSKMPMVLSRRAVSLGYSLLVGSGVLVACLLFTAPPEVPAFYANRTIEDPTIMMLVLASLAGLLSGVAMPLIGLIDSVQHMRTRESVPASLMFIVGLALLGIVAFPLSLAFFGLFSLIRRSLNKALLVILMASLFLASTLALPFPDDNMSVLQQALLFWSGRTIFPCMLAGWFIGSLGRMKF